LGGPLAGAWIEANMLKVNTPNQLVRFRRIAAAGENRPRRLNWEEKRTFMHLISAPRDRLISLVPVRGAKSRIM
jgi:hypothetical protein